MEGVFVTGTDTGVGKTTFCAGLLKLIQGTYKVRYWKPVQTGTIIGDDTNVIKELTQLNADFFVQPAYRFPDPVSPHMAAKKWGQEVDLETLKKAYTAAKATTDFMIVEGAGGLLVPLNDRVLQIDLIKAIGLPLLVVAEDRVGAINQTLLTLNAARAVGIEILGVVLTKTRKNLGNAEPIAQFGKVEILAEFDPSEDSRNVIAQVGGHEGLRKLFNVKSLPA